MTLHVADSERELGKIQGKTKESGLALELTKTKSLPGPEAAASAGAGGWVVAALGRGVVFGTKAAALRMNVIQIVRDHWVHILVPMGFVLGCYLDRKNDEKLSAFRNKSLLFK
ncbi:hypothetical protein GH733_002161, partial [Mirounga leonina]